MLDRQAVARTLEQIAPVLSIEQPRAAYHATVKADLAQIVGRAGAGKTTAARTIAAAHQESGFEVRGVALAGKAAEVLEKETGIRSRAMASLERAWSEGSDRLHAPSA
jgi:ATP-dependent exoDNAse (exonuclease V) alpha subunit